MLRVSICFLIKLGSYNGSDAGFVPSPNIQSRMRGIGIRVLVTVSDFSV